MAARGTPFKGVLFAGLMITDERPQALSSTTCASAIPRRQVLMLRLKSDLLPALLATADGVLKTFDLRWHDDAALTVVMAANGYPGDYAKGSEIRGLDAARAVEGVEIFHAGTARDGDAPARHRRPRAQCHARAARRVRRSAAARLRRPSRKIDWPGGFCRSDIGWRAIAAGGARSHERAARPVPRLCRAAHQDRRGVEIYLRTGGSGPPLLLLHGYPQTHVVLAQDRARSWPGTARS